jgi:hypothetical protein
VPQVVCLVSWSCKKAHKVERKRREVFPPERTVQVHALEVTAAMLVITQQIKAARSLVGWEQYQLAFNSGVAISTIRRIEGLKGSIGAHFETVAKIRRAFEKAGIEFLGYPSPGVRLRVGENLPSEDDV